MITLSCQRGGDCHLLGLQEQGWMHSINSSFSFSHPHKCPAQGKTTRQPVRNLPERSVEAGGGEGPGKLRQAERSALQLAPCAGRGEAATRGYQPRAERSAEPTACNQDQAYQQHAALQPLRQVSVILPKLNLEMSWKKTGSLGENRGTSRWRLCREQCDREPPFRASLAVALRGFPGLGIGISSCG